MDGLIFLLFKFLGATIIRFHFMHSFIHSFIHSGYFYSAPSSSLLLRGTPRLQHIYVSEFHTEALQATVSKGLAQGPYVVARVGVEPTTLWLIRLKVIDSTNAPPHHLPQ